LVKTFCDVYNAVSLRMDGLSLIGPDPETTFGKQLFKIWTVYQCLSSEIKTHPHSSPTPTVRQDLIVPWFLAAAGITTSFPPQDSDADCSEDPGEAVHPIAAAWQVSRVAIGLGPPGGWVHPDCGFWMLKRSVSDRKIAALVKGRDKFLGL
jgi:hypothetical protein